MTHILSYASVCLKWCAEEEECEGWQYHVEGLVDAQEHADCGAVAAYLFQDQGWVAFNSLHFSRM